jgi:2-oxoisovalerate dehydrogenase E1 component alpha subunit
VVFLVQNNGYAISVPLAKQTAAPALAYRGVGYGVRSVRIDGNDAAAVFAAVRAALARAAGGGGGGGGGGQTLIEAVTYRVEAHTNADDAARYRPAAEVDAWLARDPLRRLESYLRGRGLLDDAGLAAISADAERRAARVREAMSGEPDQDPAELFAHVYAQPTAALAAQREFLLAEIADEGETP